MSPEATLFQLGYQLSPIILTGGIATPIPGKMLPIIAITQAANFTLGILNGSDPIDPNAFFGQFHPLPGATLVDNELGRYPFANQTIAANAIIANPLRLSMMMTCPANQPGAYVAKLATFTALKSALDTHVGMGGTFTVATPSFIYNNMILLRLSDASNAASRQVQNAWIFDFEKPLIAQADAITAVGQLMSKIGGGLPSTTTAWSSAENAVNSAAGSAFSYISNLGTTPAIGIASSYASEGGITTIPLQ